ncbi:hypothetical protein SJPD1_0606 [Sulfurospirillum diekertiae]|uniref:Uncharacterized protein n=1 Tax=Sulfurospirillum diekertiae TaxID=1854492 RepID=A0A290HBW9_9BACT|nr:hypothetical protein [Sulfurospirillum diekertiae]ATB68721.1 hypothetical protein SJPD1_0606 [Sulfurospirillum diekertiae]
MTITDDNRMHIGPIFTDTSTSIAPKKEDSALSSFADELESQLASNNSNNVNPNKPAATEPTESDMMVDEFKKTLGTKGALTFFQDYNNEKIEKMIEEKKAELEDKLGLSADAQPPLTGNARAEALASLDQMLSDFRKQLMDKLNTDTKIDQQNSMLNTFLQKMG